MFHAFGVLYVPLLVSIAGLVAGAATGHRLLAAAAAGLGTVFLALAAIVLNAHLATDRSSGGGRHAGSVDVGETANTAQTAKSAKAHATLLAIGWAWGGVAMLAVYLLSGLKWQHGWQYGSGMVLVAGLILAYAAGLARGVLASGPALTAARVLSGLQGMAAAGGVAWLALSGKLATEKGDWAANDIFIAGGLAIVALTVLGLVARRA